MKVKCIEDNIGNLYFIKGLTVGKTYNVIKENGRWYTIIDDNGKEEYHLKYYFKPLSEIRNETINKLLEE